MDITTWAVVGILGGIGTHESLLLPGTSGVN
jgi:hypothetical protein